MKIYTKILLATLPMVLVSILTAAGVTYYFSKRSLTSLAENWLETRLSRVIKVAVEYYEMLDRFGMEDSIPAQQQVRIDAMDAMSGLEIGQQGFPIIVDANGKILAHRDKGLIGSEVVDQAWFHAMKNTLSGRFIYSAPNATCLAMYQYFHPWQWYIIVADPESELYGSVNRITPYIFIMAVIGSVIMSLALMFFTRKLTEPLKLLTTGAEQIGKGDLTTRITVNTRDELGRLAQVFNSMTEQLRKIHDDLRNREEHFRSLIENASDIITILDDEGVIQYESPSIQRILGYQPDELMHHRLYELVHPEDLPQVQQVFQQVYQSPGTTRSVEFRFRHKDGSWRFIEAIANKPITASQFEGMVVNWREITERKQAEADLQKAKEAAEAANRAKSQFLASMSHEIRTPMNAVLGFAELLSSMITDPRQKEYLEAISSGGKTLLSLINDILDLSKIEAGRMIIQYDSVNIRSLFKEIENMFARKIKDKGLDFEVMVDPEMPQWGLLDEVRLRQVLFNLVGNAVKFTDKGMIRLSAQYRFTSDKKDMMEMRIAVMDTGIGMPEDQKELIFEAFRQMEGQSQAKFGGTGLGLAITRRLVEMMNGRIYVESEPGKGSTFYVILSDVAVAAPQNATDDDLPVKPDAIRFQNPYILIADDIASNRNLLKGYLEGSDIKIIEAENGKDALDLTSIYKPELILMDIKMQVMDGFEATKLLKGDKDLRSIPVIAVTASVMKEEESQIKNAGFDGMLKKPISKIDLIKELIRFLPHTTKTMANHQTEVPEGQAPEFVITDAVRARLPELLKTLETEMEPVWARIHDTCIVDEIEQFAEQIVDLGQDYQIEKLAKWGEELLTQARNFDIEKLPVTLGHFPDLKQYIANLSQSAE